MASSLATNDIMARSIATNAVNSGFEPRSGQTTTIKLVVVVSPLNTHYKGEITKTGVIIAKMM